MLQRWLSSSRRFERTYGIHSQMFRVREELDHERMKMKATFSFETLGTNYPTKGRRIPETGKPKTFTSCTAKKIWSPGRLFV